MWRRKYTAREEGVLVVVHIQTSLSSEFSVLVMRAYVHMCVCVSVCAYIVGVYLGHVESKVSGRYEGGGLCRSPASKAPRRVWRLSP